MYISSPVCFVFKIKKNLEGIIPYLSFDGLKRITNKLFKWSKGCDCCKCMRKPFYVILFCLGAPIIAGRILFSTMLKFKQTCTLKTDFRQWSGNEWLIFLIMVNSWLII
ncbi:unnamed protein product [Didymodactylos carnosus]|uniref:Uncharacterized protein n=1 Tax=Didymodactylos carnosus TaxID=1234261 RepID=A0A815BZG5_9BILA|nr:unnamed protein product [Didymodactylos carnosus]CAF4063835.1 unnamed protein product [Didymodactylos carnosus]